MKKTANGRSEQSSNLNEAKDVVFAHNQVILTFIADFLAGIFAIKHDIARLNGHQVAVFARAHSNYLATLWLFLGGN